MKRYKINAWKLYNSGIPICILTNGFVKNDGTLVMGRGIAQQATKYFPTISRYAGYLVRKNGNCFQKVSDKLFMFPTKYVWYEPSSFDVIEESCIQMMKYLDEHDIKVIGLPCPGIGNGKLEWCDVEKICEKYLDKRVKLLYN